VACYRRKQLLRGLVGESDGTGGIHSNDSRRAAFDQHLNLLLGVFTLPDLFGQLLQMFHRQLPLVY